MTKQKPGADERTGATRSRAAKFPAAAAVRPVEKSVLPVKETISLTEEDLPPAAPVVAEAAPVVAEAAPSSRAPVVAEAAPVVAEAAPEVAPAPAHQPAEVPTQIVLLAGEAEPTGREPRSAVSFAWSLRSLEFWRENTQALYRLASELGAARTPSEIVEAHSKFAVERLRAFGRHAEEMSPVRVKQFFAA